MPDYFTLLRDRVTLKYCSIDRIFLQADVPKLQTVGQVCTFLRWQRRFPIPSSAAFGKIGDAYVEAIYGYAKAHNIPVVRFEKGEDKEKAILLDPKLPEHLRHRNPLAAAWRQLDAALDDFTNRQLLAA
jgi:hypothetical protein